jgi:hypothetical protein
MANRHRFERAEAGLRRAKPKRRPYDRMLIVCEGAKTEVNYFVAMRRELRIPGADIQIVHSPLGTEPIQIVESAEQLFRASKAFDRVFAVFDRDDHLTYNNALAKAAALDGKLKNDNDKAVPFMAIPSVPNFEFWILLHFKNVLAFMPREDVYAELKKAPHYPAYAKNSLTVYATPRWTFPWQHNAQSTCAGSTRPTQVLTRTRMQTFSRATSRRSPNDYLRPFTPLAVMRSRPPKIVDFFRCRRTTAIVTY